MVPTVRCPVPSDVPTLLREGGECVRALKGDHAASPFPGGDTGALLEAEQGHGCTQLFRRLQELCTSEDERMVKT